jgi:FkbM family methyltransferase
MNVRDRLIRTHLFRVAKWPTRVALRRLGYEIQRIGSSEETVIRRLLRSEDVDLVVDVGANQGQYGGFMRLLGYSGEMISFEPSADAYRLLERSTKDDANWTAVQAALGATRDIALLNVSANSVSSSLLPVTSRHRQAERASERIASERVPVLPLDAQLDRYGDERRIWLKLDVQGYEGEVLKGATYTLPRCRVIQCEASLQALYEGGTDYLDLLRIVHDEGFTMVWIEPGFIDHESGELLQFDFIAVRR